MEFLNEITPINTQEKVLDLIDKVRNNQISYSNFHQFIINVSFHIRKKKLQIFFREEMSKIKALESLKTPVKKLKSSPSSTSRQIQSGEKPLSKEERKKLKKEKKIKARILSYEKQLEKKSKSLSNNSVLYISPKNIVGQNAKNIIDTFKIQPQQFYDILKSLNLNRDKIFTRHDYNKLRNPLNELITEKAGKLMAGKNNNISKSVLHQNERNKKTYGNWLFWFVLCHRFRSGLCH